LSKLLLATLVVGPPALRPLDVALLLFLRATGQQHDQVISIATEIDSIARSPVDSPLENARTYGFRIAEIAFRHSLQCCGDLTRCLNVQMLEPCLERLPSLSILVNDQFEHVVLVTYTLRVVQGTPAIDDHAVILGQRYAHGAFIPEEGTTNEVFENPRAPSGSPGSRAPHVELMQGPQAVSVHDLVGKRFLLIVGNDAKGWTDAAHAAASEFGLDLEARSLVSQNDASRSKLVEAYDIGARGAVLIRPDGVIAWRSRTDPANAPITLRNACRSILGHASWSGVVW